MSDFLRRTLFQTTHCSQALRLCRHGLRSIRINQIFADLQKSKTAQFKKIKKIAPFGLSVGCLDTVRTSKLKPFLSYFCPPFFIKIVFQSIVSVGFALDFEQCFDHCINCVFQFLFCVVASWDALDNIKVVAVHHFSRFFC